MKMLSKIRNALKRNVVVTFLLIVAFVMAFMHMTQQTFFYYDQARDAYEAYSIWNNHDFKILGPATDITGVFHGVFWYYLLSVLYGIGNNDPQISMILLFILLLSTVPMVGLVADRLFHSKKTTVISMLLYAFSPLFQLSSRWLSNPTLGMLVMPFLLHALWKYCQKKSLMWAMIAGLLFGVLIQSDLAYILLLFLLPVYILYFRLYKNIKSLVVLCISILFILSSYFASELKFNGQSIKAAVDFLTAKNEQSLKSLGDVLVYTIQKIAEFFSNSVLPLPQVAIYIFIAVSVVGLIVNRKKIFLNKNLVFILIWLSGLFIFLIFNTGISRSLFVFFPFLSPLVIVFSYLIVSIFNKRTVLLLVTGLLILFQISKSYTYVKEVSNPLTVQKGMTLPIEKLVIDYTYRSSDGENFQINTITVPLYINTTWAYLYNFYGLPKYGYLPFWAGKDQTGRLGSLPSKKAQTKLRYLIIEPSTGIPDFFITQIILEEDQVSKLVEEKRIGHFRIQKRLEIVRK